MIGFFGSLSLFLSASLKLIDGLALSNGHWEACCLFPVHLCFEFWSRVPLEHRFMEWYLNFLAVLSHIDPVSALMQNIVLLLKSKWACKANTRRSVYYCQNTFLESHRSSPGSLLNSKLCFDSWRNYKINPIPNIWFIWKASLNQSFDVAIYRYSGFRWAF